jgi:hypothetical protein
MEAAGATLSLKKHKVSYTLGLETRRKRRAAVLKIIDRLNAIQWNEEAYMYNTPESLQCTETYANAEENVSYLQDAIIALMETY